MEIAVGKQILGFGSVGGAHLFSQRREVHYGKPVLVVLQVCLGAAVECLAADVLLQVPLVEESSSHLDDRVLVTQIMAATQYSELRGGVHGGGRCHLVHAAEIVEGSAVLLLVVSEFRHAHAGFLHIGIARYVGKGTVLVDGMVELPELVVTVGGIVLRLGAIAPARTEACDVGGEPRCRLGVVAHDVLQFGRDIDERVLAACRGDIHLGEALGVVKVLADIVGLHIYLLQPVECGVRFFAVCILLDGGLECLYRLVVLLHGAVGEP